MEQYPANPNNPRKDSKIPEKKVEKVISGSAMTKKKSGMQKFADVFVSEDVSDVKSYILLDVLLPAVKNVIADVVKGGIDMFLYGREGVSRSRGGSRASKVSYSRYYERESDRRHRDREMSERRATYDYDNIVLTNRGDAEEVLIRMDELVKEYGMVSVGDLYELVGIDGDYTNNKYGWTDISSATAVRVRDGYLLKFPRALPLN